MNGINKIVGCAAVLGALCLLVSGCGSPPAPKVPTAEELAAQQVERGRYLVTSGGCNDCHTPYKMGPRGPEPDMARMLSGHPADVPIPPAPAAVGPWIWGGLATNTAFWGPWGVSISPNLTPDEATGLGGWTEEMFLGALKHGKFYGTGRPLLPPMPWPWYANLTDDDAKAIFAYLKTIPAISNQAPPSIVAPVPGAGAAPGATGS